MTAPRLQLVAALALFLSLPGLSGVFAQSDPVAPAPDLNTIRDQFYSGHYQNGAFDSLTFVNSLLGWDNFFYAGYLGQSTVIGNVEAGNIWFGHEVYNRPPTVPSSNFTFTNNYGLNELDFHATAVGNILGGTGYVAGSNPYSYTYAGLGMAPYASLWSGGIATSFSPDVTGSFDTTADSTLAPYLAFFNGINGRKADVINSSWGGSDPAATSEESVTLDSLALKDSTVAFVAAAGNEGAAASVSAPGSVFNNITVGSLGGTNFTDSSAFTSSGPVDFYNPQTDTTITGVRAAVDIAAPGEQMVLAAYLGKSGSLGATSDPTLQAITQDTPPTDQYFLNLDGTSFATPIVSGGIALLKDVANTHPFLNYLGDPNAEDTRVIKSVLMAGADRTTGWNNGQSQNASGTVVTTQALDYATGAGALDLNKAVDIYFFGTRDSSVSGGTISDKGWDFSTLGLGLNKDYTFNSNFSANTELTVSLNWFANQQFNSSTNRGTAASFTNLDLEIWQIQNGVFTTLVGQSVTTYNNSEFLRLDLPTTGLYGLRVLNNGLVFDLTGGNATTESYGLAWEALTPTPTPTPSPVGPTEIGEDIPAMPPWALVVLFLLIIYTVFRMNSFSGPSSLSG